MSYKSYFTYFHIRAKAGGPVGHIRKLSKNGVRRALGAAQARHTNPLASR